MKANTNHRLKFSKIQAKDAQQNPLKHLQQNKPIISSNSLKEKDEFK